MNVLDARPVSCTISEVVIAQRFLAHYRTTFAEDLDRRLDEEGYRLHYLYTRTLGNTRPPPCCRRIAGFGIDLRVGHRQDTLLFAPGLTREVAAIGPSVLILGDVGEIPNNLLLARYALNWGIPYLIWGLGSIPHNPSSSWRSVLRPAIHWLYSHAAGFLCYGTHAESVYRPYGKPCYIATNASRRRANDEERRAIHAAIQRRSEGAPIGVAFVGQLTDDKRVDVLLRALAQIPLEQWRLHVVGTGPRLGDLRRMAETAGIAGSVVFHGAVFDPAEKFAILSACHLGVLPGRGGLAIQELLWHGVSVVSGIADGTERDLISPANGTLISGWLTEDSIRDAVESYLRLDTQARERRALAALHTVDTIANSAAMTEGFVAAIRANAPGSKR